MTDRELMQQALDALEYTTNMTAFLLKNEANIGPMAKARASAEALRDRLAQTELVGKHLQFSGTMHVVCQCDKCKAQPEPPCKTGSQCVGGKCERCAVEPVAWFMEGTYEDGTPSFTQVCETDPEFYVPLYTAPPRKEWQPKGKLWLWKNFVDGKPEYWAFDNPYPTNLDNGDPQTIGEPCGYAIFKPSRDGSDGRTEEYVLSQISKAVPYPRKEWIGLTDEEIGAVILASEITLKNYCSEDKQTEYARSIEAKLKEKNHDN